jgi:acetyltransferase-like isoleucine patch superfamily enzyme
MPAGRGSVMATLNRLSALRRLLVGLKREYYNRVWGMDLHPTCTFSLSARFDLTYPKGVHVGAETYVAFDAAILAHDRTRRLYADTRIGKRCFIGARSIILPGIEIGDDCVVGSGSVVTKNVPARSVVAGNPAKVLRSEIVVGPYGQFIEEVAQ